jgi:hypothetical protein
MKRMSRISCTLALLLMSLSTVPSANAVGLLGVGPPPAVFTNSAIPPAVVTVPGLPAWFQDQNGVAVQPCLDAVPCALVARALNPLSVPPVTIAFDPALPLVFPSNFPDEAFYFAATATFPVGPNTAQFVVTQEFVFLDNPDPLIGKPTFPGAAVAVPAPFQRLRFDYVFTGFNPTNFPLLDPIPGGIPPAAALTGLFKLTTPWGDTTFNLQDALTNTKTTNTKCEIVGALHDTHCTFTRDTFFTAVAPAFVPDFTSALAGAILPTDFGGNPMSTFLQDPLAPAGFVGTAATAPLSFTGAPAGRPNLFSVTDPMGNTGSTTSLQSLTGKKFGMDVAPLAFDFGTALPVTTPVTTSPATTITVTNPDTVNALTMGTVTFTGTNPADFTITADTCSGQILAAATVPFDPAQTTNKCTFAAAFAPKRLAAAPEVALRTAMASIAGTYAGVAAPTRLVTLSGTAQHTIAANAGANGGISPSGGAVVVSAGATQDFTITPSAKFQVKDILVNGLPATFTKAANLGGAVTFTTPADTTSGTTVNATFMPSGDLDGDGILDVKDALKALKILAGLFPSPAADDLVAMKVTPLDAAGRPNGTGAPDLNDVVLILWRVLGIKTW